MIMIMIMLMIMILLMIMMMMIKMMITCCIHKNAENSKNCKIGTNGHDLPEFKQSLIFTGYNVAFTML